MSELQNEIIDFYRPANPDTPELLEYSLTDMKDLETSRGVAWTAQINRNGKKVAIVENFGDGGANFYLFESPDAQKHFFDLARKTYPSTEFSGEEEDILAGWLDVKRDLQN